MSPIRAVRRRVAAAALASAVLGAMTIVTLSDTPATAVPDPAAARDKVAGSVLAKVDAGRPSTFFVVLDDSADLSAARSRRTHAARAGATYAALRAEAEESQAPVVDLLESEGVSYESFWIANTVLVTSDDADLVDELAARTDVASIVPERHYPIDEVEKHATPARHTAAADGTPEWGVADIKADQVWSQYDDRGEGIVIASVDSGVQFDHPALVGSYRGNNGDGTFSHDYNWFDASGQCPQAGVPCDNNGHGTHTMGTMVGADGIGVAPGATWVAAKGCETKDCSDSSLLAAGQWILAPTDSTGKNPRPDLAPNIVNNSWGGGHTTFYGDVISAWNAAGIFEAFAAGNKGDGTTCSTTETPGSQADAYGVGAYDSTGAIAGFSGFGPSLEDGSAKPNIAAPGVAVRSSWPGDSYETLDGTSMATPHVAGAVALLWSEAPSLIGRIDETRALLGGSARDVDDTHCGGTAESNNVWGEGKLDVLAAVDAGPHTAAIVTGSIADADSAAPIAHAELTFTDGTTTRRVSTGSDGSYRVTLEAGTYQLSASGYGYTTSEEDGFEVVAGADASHDITLHAVPHHAVTGTVLDAVGKPLAHATVRVLGTPIPDVTTDGRGAFTIADVAEGAFTVSARPAAPVRCNGAYAGSLAVDGAERVTVRLPARTDAFGNSCIPVAAAWAQGTHQVTLSGDEDVASVKLPFAVSLYGTSYRKVAVTTDGLLQFESARIGDYENTALPTTLRPNGTLAVFWDDLVVDRQASVRTATLGKAGSRRFVIEWRNVALAGHRSSRVSFEVVFRQSNGSITLQYRGISKDARERGSSATIGLEDQTGSDALQYSFDQNVVRSATAIRIRKATR